MKATAQVRSDLYAALALAFSPPEPSLVLAGAGNYLVRAVTGVWNELSLPEMQGELAALVMTLEDISYANEGAALQTLAAQYTATFDAPGRSRVHPYESIYRDPDGQVMGACTTTVMDCYRKEGLRLAPDFRDLPDHIAAELEFMAYLCTQEAEAWEEARWEDAMKWHLKQRAFLEEHLLQWASAFCRRLASVASSPYYLCAASITQRFLAGEYESILATRRPADDRQPPRRRASTSEGCVLCAACVVACAPDALTVRPEGAELVLLLDEARCNGCGHCVTACPEGAITLKELADEAPPDSCLTLVRVKQGVCAGCKTPLGPLPLLQKIMHSLEQAGQNMAPVALLCPQCKAERLTSSVVGIEKLATRL